MAVVINGSGTVTGISVGGLPDGIVDSGTLATNSVDSAELIDGAVDDSHMASISGRKNLIINGGFDVWQRGTSLAGDSNFLADRWINTSSETQSRQTFTVGQTDVPHNPTYYHRGAGGSTEWYELRQKVENVALTAGRELTLSYWMKGSSAFTNAPYINQEFGSGGSSNVSAALSTASVTTSWARYTHTFTPASVSGKTIGTGSFLKLSVQRASNNNITVDIANVQLELGSIATNFEHRSYGEELALCQRYYFASDSSSILFANANGNAGYSGRERYQVHNPLPTVMRATPTVVLIVNNSGGTSFTLDSGTSSSSAVTVRPSTDPVPSGAYWYGKFTADAEL